MPPMGEITNAWTAALPGSIGSSRAGMGDADGPGVAEATALGVAEPGPFEAPEAAAEVAGLGLADAWAVAGELAAGLGEVVGVTATAPNPAGAEATTRVKASAATSPMIRPQR